MKFKCEKCGTRYTIADEKVQNRVLKIRCKVCENVITVRDPDGAGLEAQPSAIRRPTSSRAPAIAATSLGDDFPNDRTSVGDPLAPVSDVEWYCAPDSGQAGPMPLERLRDMIRTGDLKGEDFVWNETMSDWVPASTVNVLGDLFRPKAARPPPPRRRRRRARRGVRRGVRRRTVATTTISPVVFVVFGNQWWRYHFCCCLLGIHSLHFGDVELTGFRTA